MEIWQAVLLGIIQGITEWFPVSSSGHLVLTKHFLDIEPSLFFDVFIHFGSAIVVLFIFRKDVKDVIVSFFSALIESPESGLKAFTKTGKRKLATYIIIGSIPTGIIGLLVSIYYEGFFSDPIIVGIALLVTGIVLLTTKDKDGKKTEEYMDTKDALSVGFMQGLASIPGISRSGFTISASLDRGIERETAARYSFLLFLPAITAAGILKITDLPKGENPDLMILMIGTITAMLVGYITIKALLALIRKGEFYKFSIYCFAVGIIVILLSI